jgi:hypothetical protein
MMRSTGIVAFVLLVMLTASLSNGESPLSGSAVPFRPGEKLTYDLYWEFIHAGTALLEVTAAEEYEGVSAFHFVMTVKTNSVIDRIYKVRDYIESFTDRPLSRSLMYRKKQEEGKHRRDITVKFDWEKSQAQYSDFGKGQKPIPIVGGTFDPLSILYAIRLMPLKENTEVETPVSDGKKCVIGKARVLGGQKISVGDRDYQTRILEPDLKDLGGIFRKSKGAQVQIWVTEDERRIPVKVTSKVAVGHFVAELKEARNGSANVTGN